MSPGFERDCQECVVDSALPAEPPPQPLQNASIEHSPLGLRAVCTLLSMHVSTQLLEIFLNYPVQIKIAIILQILTLLFPFIF